MEQLISEIQAYVAAQGGTPQKFLRRVIGAKWGTWQSWLDHSSSPTMASADRIRAYMAENPPSAERVEAAE